MPKAIPDYRRSFAWFFLILGIVAAGVAYWQGKVLVDRELNASLEVRTKTVKNSVEPHIRTYIELIRSIQTQFMLHPHFSRRDFQNLYHALSLYKRMAGIQAIGFSSYVTPGSNHLFAEHLHGELATNTVGYPKQSAYIDNQSRDSYIVNYVEPVSTNHFAVGKDQGAELIRRTAIERARDTGDLAVTGRVALFVAPDLYDGVVFFMPLYRHGTVPTTLQQRREDFIGVVFVVVRIDEMLSEVLGQELLKLVDVEIYEVDMAGREIAELGVHNLIFDSSTSFPAAALHAKNKNFPLQRSEYLNLTADTWQLQVTALPGSIYSTQRWLPLLAALSAAALFLLASFFMRQLERKRNLAEDRAYQAERSLQSREAQLTRISDSIEDVLWAIEIPSRVTQYLSAGVERIYGRPAQDFYENPLLWTKCIHPDDLNLVLGALDRTIRNGQETVQYRIVRPNLEVRWIQVKAYFVATTSAETGIMDGIITDVTDDRRLQLYKNKQVAILEQIAKGGSSMEVLDAAAQLIESQNPGSMCTVMLLNEDGKRLHKAAGSTLPVEFSREIEGIQIGPDVGCCGTAAFERRLVIASDIATDPLWKNFRELALRHNLHACWSYPIVSSTNQVLGTFAVYSCIPHAPGQTELEMLTSCAHIVSIAIERERTENKARTSEADLRLRQRAIESSANPIAITRAVAPDYPIEYVNPAFEQVSGYTAAELLGKNLLSLCRDDLKQPGLTEMQKAHEQQHEGQALIRAYRKDGVLVWLDVYVSPVRDETDRVTHFVSAIYDITATKLYQSELEYQANYDALTGLANRNLLRDRLHQAIARLAGQENQQLWVASLNLDRFKFVNDTMGQAAGDTVLQQVAQRLQAILPPSDTVARVAADEFVLLLTESRDEHAVSSMIQSAMQAVAQPVIVREHQYFLTCSTGIAMYPNDGDHPEALLKNADIAMERAKEIGRNNFQFYTAIMNQRAMERLRLEGDLRHALERNELLLHYQPQVDLATGRIVGAEALLRWHHPQRGLIRPDQFIPIAEESGLIVAIGAWVMRTACLQNMAWQKAGLKPLRIGVNLSCKQFYQLGLTELVASVLHESGLSAEYLDIELTEGLVMDDVEQAVAIMHSLKAVGVQLSMDDFGTGYSSLSYLRRFPIDVLKIDQSFVQSITADADQAAITRSIIMLAQNLRLKVIAEGVETQEQLDYLRQHQCNEIQGFYFSRPLPVSDFEQLLIQNKCLPEYEGVM